MLYVLGDLHLSFAANKKMDVFGGAWEGYEDKLRSGLSVLRAEDTLVLCGDSSWGISLMESLPDFGFLDALPGRKILLKGNHDYFWDTVSKMQRFLQANGMDSLSFLHNNAWPHENVALCGTRGWFFEEERGTAQDEKIMNREIGRLRLSLERGRAMTDGELIVFLHYPPVYEAYRCRPILDLFAQYGVRRCYYGHLHGPARARATEGLFEGVLYRLISADHVRFTPVPVPLATECGV